MNNLSIKKEVDKSVSDHVYVNMSIKNNDNTYIKANNFNVQFSTPLIEDPGDYNITIARFAIDSNCIFKVSQPASASLIDTAFWIGLQYDGNNYDIPILIPINNWGNTDLRVCYSVQEFLNIVNIALEDAISDLNVAYPGIVPDGTVMMIFDNTTQLFRLVYPSHFVSDDIKVTMSYMLYTRIGDMNIENSPKYPFANNHTIVFSNFSTGINFMAKESIKPVTRAVLSTNYYMYNEQNNPFSASLSDLEKLIIVANDLPVQPENIYSNSNVNLTNANQSLLTDFLIGGNNLQTSLQEPLVYTPSLYRLIDLTESRAISSISFSVYLQHQDGSVIPLWIRPEGWVSIKFLFLRKGLMN